MKQRQTDWEAAYQAGDTPWEKGAPHPALIDYVAARGRPRGEILVPGCGSGHDVRALSDETNRVVGIDLAPSAIDRANAFPKTGREEYLLLDLFDAPAEWAGRFDVIFEHTCFCAIHPAARAEYVSAVVRLLKPGGKLIAVFFIDPDEPIGPPFRVGRAELDRRFDPHFSLVEESVPQRTYPGREGRELFRVLLAKGAR